MVTKVGNNSETPNRVVVSGQNSKAKATLGETANQPQRSPNANSKEKLTITRVSVDLQNALKSLSDVPIVDTNRVDKLKGAIQQNTYKINFAKAAHKMIEIEFLLKGRD